MVWEIFWLRKGEEKNWIGMVKKKVCVGRDWRG